ncbi:barstar family protein [Streptomyces tendae]|uniref:barstar family protein n=1 Tax=Streptomyces tendae TaxID=1932 RepID=UPI0036606001
MWPDLAPEDRHAWLSVALWSREYQRQGRPDTPAGQVFTLDGRHIVDRDSFYCAIGEAINGPGGYFGWNLDALDDCLRGGWGATAPFTLHWDSSAEARARLVERVPTGDGELSLFDLLLKIWRDGASASFFGDRWSVPGVSMRKVIPPSSDGGVQGCRGRQRVGVPCAGTRRAWYAGGRG